MKRNWISLVILFFSLNSVAGLIQKTMEVNSTDKNASSAKRELMEQAQTKAIEEAVKAAIGEERYLKNKNLIQSKILKVASRLIPFSKAGNLEATDTGHRMTVVLQVNQDDVDQVLMQNGLFYEADVPAAIIPLVVWNDGFEKVQYGWWSPVPVMPYAQLELDFETSARNQFLKNGFMMFRPGHFNFKEANQISLGASPNMNDIQALGKSKEISVALTGEFKISPHASKSQLSVIEIKLSVVHLPRQRTLATVVRRLEIEGTQKNTSFLAKLKDSFDSVLAELAQQSLEAWQKGRAQSNSYKVTLLGSVTPIAQESFKEAFHSKVREVRVIRERSISAQAVTYDIDSTLAPKEIAKRVTEVQVGDKRATLKDSSDSEVRFQFQE